MLRLARYLKYFKKEVILGPFFKLLEAVFELMVPLVMASIIDVGIKNKDGGYVIEKGGLILFLGLVGLVFALICQYSAARASQGFGTMVRNDLFIHINSLSHVELDQIGTNSLITRITNDVNQMQLAVAMLIRLVVRAPFLIIGSTVMAMFLDWQMSCIFLVIAPLVSFVLYVVMKKSIPYYRIRQKSLDKVSLITKEALSGARVIRVFSKQEQEQKRFQEANDDVSSIATEVGKISAILNPATFIILNIAIVVIIWAGGKRVDQGVLSQGQIIAFANYMTQISLTLVVVANLVVIFTKASASATRINEVFEMTSSVNGGTLENISTDSCEGPLISLKHVYFTYPGTSEYALENIHLDIYKGETIGIIGGTGSGKSTLIQLLSRLYEVTKGEILINQIPLKEYDIKSLRKLFGIVPQKTTLFYGTILENILFGREENSIEEVEKVMEVAMAEEFVDKLENGYDTMIMQGGKNLSGGQRQRLTIARALLGYPSILILDDSFSALDYATDAAVRKSLSEYRKGMTTIIVSQRANTIKNADRIIVLEDGKIEGIGTHEQLLQQCFVYGEICLSQLTEEGVKK